MRWRGLLLFVAIGCTIGLAVRGYWPEAAGVGAVVLVAVVVWVYRAFAAASRALRELPEVGRHRR